MRAMKVLMPKKENCQTGGKKNLASANATKTKRSIVRRTKTIRAGFGTTELRDTLTVETIFVMAAMTPIATNTMTLAVVRCMGRQRLVGPFRASER